MSDYTNTFTEGTGDTIDTTDFSVEFSAIETAIATKLDTDSDTATNLTIGAGFGGGAIVRETAIATTSGTTHSFTGIPSWVKRITLIFDRVGTNGTDNLAIQLGDSGGFETTTYNSIISRVDASATQTYVDSSTSRILISRNTGANDEVRGLLNLVLVDGTTWIISGVLGTNTSPDASFQIAGTKTLSGTLDRVQLLTDGTDTFDNGTFNILYEG